MTKITLSLEIWKPIEMLLLSDMSNDSNIWSERLFINTNMINNYDTHCDAIHNQLTLNYISNIRISTRSFYSIPDPNGFKNNKNCPVYYSNSNPAWKCFRLSCMTADPAQIFTESILNKFSANDHGNWA